ncbi:MAG: polymer-forming cytoskeletal protein [Deltaproteobacteria bacterium]|nr:polymer-forming cytoskeletal protein [Deltaproteobacteria bacterium]
MAMLKREEENAFKQAGGTATLLGAGSEFEGKLTFQGSVHIDGKFSGEIRTSDDLTVGQAAKVSAQIHVGSIVVHGEIQGDVHAKNLVELESTARVFGTIETPALVVKKGAIFEGTTKMGAKVTPINAAAAAAGPAPGAK